MADLVLRLNKTTKLQKWELDQNFTRLNDELTALQASSPKLISRSYAGVTRSSDNATDTSFVTLASIIVPGGTMNLNGEIVVTQDWKVTKSASVKTLAMDWGGVNVSSPTVNNVNVIRTNYRVSIKNLDSLSSQSIFGHISFGEAWGDTTGSIDTAGNVVIDHKCKWGANVVGEQITLIGYSVQYLPGSV